MADLSSSLEQFFASIRERIEDIKTGASSEDTLELVSSDVAAHANEDKPAPQSDQLPITVFDAGTSRNGDTDGHVNFVIATEANNTLIGFGGIDVLLGNDLAIDTVDYRYLNEGDSTTGVFVDLAAGIAYAGGGDIDILSSIENVIGSANADILLGNGLSNIFVGMGGNDLIDGRGGDHDVVQFAGKAEDYQIAGPDENGAFTVSLIGSDWTTTLYNIELLQFAEGSEDGGVTLFNLAEGGIVARDDVVDILETEGDDSGTEAVSFNLLEGVGDQPADNQFGTLDEGDPRITGVSHGQTEGSQDGNLLIIEGEYGTLTLNTLTGEASYTYSDAVNAIPAGAMETDTFIYEVVGGDKAEIKINITGSNDAPAVTWTNGPQDIFEGSYDTGSASSHSIAAAIGIEDVDTEVTAENFSVEVVGTTVSGVTDETGAVVEVPDAVLEKLLTPLERNFEVDAYEDADPHKGTARLTYRVKEQDIDFLNEGDVLTIVYTVRVFEKNDPSSFVEQPVTIVITGTNDAPVLEAQTLAAQEDGDAVSLDLKELADDADAGDTPETLIYSIESGPEEGQGSASIENGVLTFDPGEDFQHLNVNDTADVVIRVKADDGKGGVTYADVTVTVSGNNDAPVIDWTNGDRFITEGSNTSSGILIGLFDPDTEVTEENFDVVITGVTSQLQDGSGAPINGQAAIISQLISSVEANLDVNGAPDGTSDTDPNRGTARVVLNFNEADIDFLAEGDVLTLVYSIKVVDSGDTSSFVTKDVTVTISGTNDAPVIDMQASDLTGEITEAGVAADGSAIDPTGSISGRLVASDVDTGDEAFWSSEPDAANADLGSFVLDASGKWTFTLDEGKADSLDAGETVTLTYWVTVSDREVDGLSETKKVEITITGTNDAPELSDQTLDAAEDGDAVSFDLKTVASDVDGDDTAETLTYSIDKGPEDGEGSASIENGVLTFDPGEDFQHLNVDETAEVVIRVKADDGKGGVTYADVTVTVSGNNDAPVVEWTNGDRTTLEGQNSLHATVALVGIVDPDTEVNDDNFTVEVSEAVVGGVVNSEGEPVEAPAVDIESFASSMELDLAPGGTYSDTDPTRGTVNARFYFDEEDLDFLAEGDVLTLSYTIKVIDKDDTGSFVEQPVTITITGTNDTPLVSAVVNETVLVEDGDGTPSEPVSTTGELIGDNVSDVDNGDEHTVAAVKGKDGDVSVAPDGSTVINGTYGTLTITAAGVYTYALYTSEPANADLQALAEGEQAIEVFEYAVRDDSGASNDTSETATLTFNILGTNDDPVITTPAEVEVTETNDPDAVLEGQLEATDVDGDDLVWSLAQGQPAVAGFTLNDDGSYTFDPSDPAYNGLKEGEQQTLQIVVAVSDGKGGTDTETLEITITGSNDAPTAVGFEANVVVNLGEDVPTLNIADWGLATDPDGDDLGFESVSGTMTWGTEGGIELSHSIEDLITAGILTVDMETGEMGFTETGMNIIELIRQGGDMEDGIDVLFEGVFSVTDKHSEANAGKGTGLSSNQAEFEIGVDFQPNDISPEGSVDWTTDNESLADGPEMLVDFASQINTVDDTN